MSRSKIHGGRYLLSLRELIEEEAGMPAGISADISVAERAGDGTLLGRTLAALDRERLEKASRLRGKPRLLSAGAGLLLQLAVRDPERSGRASLSPLSVTETLRLLEGCAPCEIQYSYGSGGKPYAVSPNFSFSLSHSGTCVFCAVSDREIGADLQTVRGEEGVRRIADRFFTQAEKDYLESLSPADRRSAFYRLWTRKEAYGKWTGEGVVSALGVSLVPGDARFGMAEGLCWEETGFFLDGEEYLLAVCFGEAKDRQAL